MKHVSSYFSSFGLLSRTIKSLDRSKKLFFSGFSDNDVRKVKLKDGKEGLLVNQNKGWYTLAVDGTVLWLFLAVWLSKSVL
jgi:hypothetical protein